MSFWFKIIIPNTVEFKKVNGHQSIAEEHDSCSKISDLICYKLSKYKLFDDFFCKDECNQDVIIEWFQLHEHSALFCDIRKTPMIQRVGVTFSRKGEMVMQTAVRSPIYYHLRYEVGDISLNQKWRTVSCGNVKCKKTYCAHKFGETYQEMDVDSLKVMGRGQVYKAKAVRGRKWYICSGCKLVHFCCRKCFKYSWNRRVHKRLCQH